MYRSLKRFMLGLSVFVLFGYLVLNVGLNVGLTPVLERRAADTLEKPIDIGFVYVNWRGRPTLNQFAMGSGINHPGKDPLVRITNLEVQPAWQRIVSGKFDSRQFGFASRVRFGYLDITLADVPDHKDLFRNFPPIPARANRWRIRFLNDGDRIVDVHGRAMNYTANDQPVTLDVKQLNERKFKARANMTFIPSLDWSFDVQRGGFPEDAWPLKDDSWSGDMSFSFSGNNGELSAEFNGTPGTIRGVELPKTRLVSNVHFTGDTTNVESLRMSSDYLDFDWDGTINHTHDSDPLDLNGNLFVNVKKIGNYLFRQNKLSRFHIDQSFPLNGEFSVNGSLDDPRYSGDLNLREVLLDVSRDRGHDRFKFQEWSGSFQGDSLTLSSGRFAFRSNEFDLENGFLDFEDHQLMGSLTGGIDGGTLPKELARRINRTSFGSLNSFKSALNVSLLIGSDSLDVAFAAEDGEITFDRGQINELSMVTSFSSLSPVKTSIRGQFKGPDQNKWVIRGDHRSLRLRGTIQQLDKFPNLLSGEQIPRFKLSNSKVMFQVNHPFESLTDYYGFIKFNDGQIRATKKIPDLSGLYGEVTFTPNQIDFNELYGRFGSGKFQVSGAVSHDTGFDRGDWNLELTGTGLPVQRLTPGVAVANTKGGFDVDGDVQGGLRNPRLDVDLDSSRIKIGFLVFRDVRSSVTADLTRLSFDYFEAETGQGNVEGNGVFRFGDRFQFDLSGSNIAMSKALEEVTFFRNKTRGTIDFSMGLSGDIRRDNSWKGEITVSNENVVLDRFPEIPSLRKVADADELKKSINIDDRQQTLPIEQGKIRFNPFLLTSQGMDLDGNGFMAMNGNLDLMFDLTLKEDTLRGYLQNALGDLYRDLGLSDKPKEMNIPFSVKGDLSNPSVDIDNDKIANNFRRNLIEDVIPGKLGGEFFGEVVQELFN